MCFVQQEIVCHYHTQRLINLKTRHVDTGRIDDLDGHVGHRVCR
jgi:hypothetical protein